MAEFDPDAYLAKEEKKKGFDPDAYLSQPTTTARKEQLKAITSLGDTALNFITGGLDMAAYPLARAYYGTVGGLPPEQAAAKAQQETTSPKDVLGRAFGFAGQPSYESSPLRQAGEYVGQQLGENVITPAAQTTGLPEPDVANMVNWATLGAGAAVPKIVRPVYNAGKTAAKGVADVAGGAYGAATGKIAAPGAIPEPWQTRSVRQPVKTEYYTPEDIAAWRAGEIPTGSVQPQPIQNLGPEAIQALGRTEGNIPFAGQGMRALGEQIGETYRNPLNVLTDVGLDLATSGGLPTAARLGYKGYKGYQGVKAANTLEKAGFTPMYPEEAAALQQGLPHPSDITGPVAPTQPAGMATPAAQAAMATTQAVSQQRQPRATPQPRPVAQPFTLPDVGTHYTQAAQGSANFADTFNKAVATRTADLLKAAKQTGEKLTAEKAAEIAEADVRQWRKENVPAFQPKQEIAGPVEPTITAEQAVAEFNPPKVDPELLSDQNIWARLQAKTKAGTPLVENEQTAVRRITNKYGQDPFQTGNLNGESVLEAVDIAGGHEVRAGMKDAAKGGVSSKNGKIVIDKALFDDTARSMGMPEIDWSKVPDLTGMGLAEARIQIRKAIDAQFKEAEAYGKTTRGPNQSTLVKQAEAAMTAEERAAKNAEVERRIANMSEFLKTGKISPSTSKATTPEVAGPAVPEGVTPPAPMTKERLLDLINKRKGNPPAGTMSMMTKDGPESMFNYKGILDDVEQASHSVLQQSLQNSGKGFNVSYKHGNDFIHETKHSGYHKVEIEHPDGTMTTFTKMEGNPFIKHQNTVYMTAKVDATGIPRNQKTLSEKPEGWFSVEDEIGKGK